MDIKKHYRYLDNLDVTNIINVLDNLDESKWKINTIRQDIHFLHRKTKSIVLRFTEDDSLNFTHYKRDFPEFDMLQPILDHISTFYETGGFVRIVFALLPHGTSIDEHIDFGKIYNCVHRIHLVITTNDDVELLIKSPDGVSEKIPLVTGNLVEINNRWAHQAVNNGNTDRIHLIADYVTDAERANYQKRKRMKN